MYGKAIRGAGEWSEVVICLVVNTSLIWSIAPGGEVL